ncbi:MAG: hypothetical protein IKI54_04365 [Lachnospiraceae bacterium]|nr:hypothetical protein [Lachnospiraceae bacterium]
MNGKTKKKNQNKKDRMKGRYLFVIAAAFALLLVAAYLSNPALASDSSPAPVDETVVDSLKALEETDVGEVVRALRSIEASRKESIAESISIEESILQSSIQESIEIENSIAASIYEESVAEASRQAEWAALTKPLEGSHLVPFEVRYDLDDTDIPYLRALFSHCIVIGNSRAKNAVDCGIMSETEVKYRSGNSVEQITPFALEQAYLYAPKTLFIMGLNDIGYYNGSNERFYQDYLNMVRQYQAINPNSIIYLMEILPCPEEARPYFYRFFMIPDFNARIRQVCEETGAIYVSATPYADFKYINSHDHAHYSKDFYFLWAQTMATQMHPWEDHAGLDYDID